MPIPVHGRVRADAIAETNGIADGFGLRLDDIFAYLHLGILGDLEKVDAVAEGCTSWAHRRAPRGPLVAKNRDFRGEHVRLQRVFQHEDPAWGGRRLLCVGSLGSPGAYSSGMNSDGLAVVDTNIGTSDHGQGLNRYFLMTRLLTHCVDVAGAATDIAALAHAGGGSLVLADAGGALAAVELGHRRVDIERPAGYWTARTNHFVSANLKDANILGPDEAAALNSRGRLRRVHTTLDTLEAAPSPSVAQALMAMHCDVDGPALCRHGENDGSLTISTAIYACAERSLYFWPGNPCDTPAVLYNVLNSL